MAAWFGSIPSQRRAEESFQVAPGDFLHGRLHIVSHYPETKVFRLILLLNYRQAPFLLEGVGEAGSAAMPVSATPSTQPQARTFSDSVDIVIPSEQELRFRLWTEPLTAGYYDLALMVVVEPDKQQGELRFWTGLRPVQRHSVYVGDAVPPTVAFPPLDPPAPESPGFAELYAIVGEPYSRKLWPGRTAQPGEEITFFFNLQPRPDALLDPAVDETVPVALVAFLDDQIVPLTGEPVVYGSARPGYLSSLPVSVRAPDQPGKYQLFIQWFPQPYVDANAMENLSLFADSGQRIVIEVVAEEE